jgi:AcrR family transcriptional regulator
MASRQSTTTARRERPDNLPAPDARTRILDAATALLAEQGLRKLTQPQVCRRSGLRQSHLTYYFPTRRDLMIGVARHSIQALSRPLLSQARSGRLTPELLARTLSSELLDRARVRIIIGLVTAAEDDPEVASALHALIAGVRSRLAKLLSLLGYADDPDAAALTHMLLVGASLLHHARGNAASIREVALASRFVATELPALLPSLLPRLRQRRKVPKPVRKARKVAS